MARDKQDVHLLWIFHSDPHVGSHHEDPKVSNDEVPAVLTREQQLEIRIPTDTESDDDDDGAPGVSTAAGSREKLRIPNKTVPAVLTRQQQLEIRIPTDTESDDDSDGAPGVSTAAGPREKPRIPDKKVPEALTREQQLEIRIPTSSDSDEEPPCKKPRRQYNAGQPRRAACSIRFLGHKICRHAGRHLMRVGDERLERVRDGIIDGRHDCPHTPGKMSTSVWRFLWTLYHTVGEGMPDKFNFAMKDAQTLVMGASKTLKRKSPLPGPIDPEDIDTAVLSTVKLEEDEDNLTRSIAARATYVVSQSHPADQALLGPGMFTGPIRFLPPGKRVHLYWEYRAWESVGGRKPASFSTFLRAFGKCDQVLRIRKAGNHAVCSACTDFKKRLRNAKFPRDRQIILEQYTAHIISQWLDRQVYGNAVSVSMSCRGLLERGHLMKDMAMSASQICMAVDGMDQAKFRLPRMFVTTKCLDSLIRPALHVQGAWAHGFGYHLAVMDADMKHDSNNNVEVVSNMLEQIYMGHKGLPMGLHLQQDNTSRECKNQKILKWAIKLVSLGVFKWVTLNYLTIGHTHDDLDATFGQITVRLSEFEFDDDTDVVRILMKLLGDLGIEESSRRASRAYKLDTAASWEDWWEEIRLNFSQLTGPRAPHSFRICTRLDLGNCTGGHGELEVRAEPLVNGPRERGGDVVVVVKHYMHSKRVSQVFTAWPESSCAALCRQPAGTHKRRPVGDADRKKLIKKAEELYKVRQIEAKARDYLVEWASGTRRRLPRPTRYEFLNHNISARDHRVSERPAPPVGRVHQVLVQGFAGGPLPDAEESGDDDEDGALVCHNNRMV